MIRTAVSAALLGCLLLLNFDSPAFAGEHPVLYFFWGEGCPHCEKAKEFLPALQEKYPELEMRWFETWKHKQFTMLADHMRKAFGIKSASVPMFFLGDWSLAGYAKDETTGRQIETQVIKCIKEGCSDPIAKVGPLQIVWAVQDEAKRGAPQEWEFFPATIAPRKEMDFQQDKSEQTTETPPSVPAVSPEVVESIPTQAPTIQEAPLEEDDEVIDIPLIGPVSVTKTVRKIGLPLFTVIIGGLDGFNPCAMWVLCFLLSLVIYAKSRAKILVIGGIFVFASGFIYFLFMAAWLNLFKIVGYVDYLRIIVALAAIVMGLVNCKDFFFFKKGISLTIPESAKPKLGKRMRDIVNASAWPAMIGGTIFLAVSANLIELMCTAGFPAIYTRILTLNNFSTAQYYLYLALYNVVYVIPLAVIVGIFGWKMGGRRLSEKEGRVLKLIGGSLMLALGLIMLLKPEMLMF